MNSCISDIALDLGLFALDLEFERRANSLEILGPDNGEPVVSVVRAVRIGGSVAKVDAAQVQNLEEQPRHRAQR